MLTPTPPASGSLRGFRLSPAESAASGVQRIIQQQIDAMHRNLAQRDTDPDAIHQVRVSTKRLRALAGLLKHCCPLLAADLRQFAREISAGLSAQRDYEMLLATTRQLTTTRGKKGQVLFDEALQSLPTRPDELTATTMTDIRHKLQYLQHASHYLTSADMTHDALLARYRHNRNKLQKQWRKASLKTPQERWHELRKREKAFLYQSQLLRSLLPDMKSKYIRKMKALGQQLGDYHDLSVLADHLQADGARKHEKMQRLLRKKQKRLLKAILARASKTHH